MPTSSAFLPTFRGGREMWFGRGPWGAFQLQKSRWFLIPLQCLMLLQVLLLPWVLSLCHPPYPAPRHSVILPGYLLSSRLSLISPPLKHLVSPPTPTPAPPLPDAVLDVLSVHTGSPTIAPSTLHFTLGGRVSLTIGPWRQGPHHASLCSEHPAQCWWMNEWSPTRSSYRRCKWGSKKEGVCWLQTRIWFSIQSFFSPVCNMH